MAVSCENVSARMLELLYGELPESERAAIDTHMGTDGGGCDRCRAELADLQKTRAVARQVLDETPPARAHQAILHAAAAAVAARAPVPGRRAEPARASLWDRLRSGWTLPTLATVGAVAVLLLASKIFLEPDKTYERGRQGLVPPPAEAPGGTPAAAEPATAPRATAPTATAPTAEAPTVTAQPPATRAAAEPYAPAGGKRLRGSRKDDVGGELGNLGTIDPPAANQRRPVPEAHATAKREGLLEELAAPRPARTDPAERTFAAPPPPRAVQPARARAANDEIMGLAGDDAEKSRQSEGRGGGLGGAATKALAPKAAVPAKTAKKGFGGLDDGFDGRAAGSAGPAPTGPLAQEAAPRGKSARSSSAPAPAPPPTSAPAPAERDFADKASENDAAAAARSGGLRKAEPPFARDQTEPKAETPVARADRLFSQARWTEAAVAYRDLLRRDPRNADAGRWRQRLAACRAALAPAAVPPP